MKWNEWKSFNLVHSIFNWQLFTGSNWFYCNFQNIFRVLITSLWKSRWSKVKSLKVWHRNKVRQNSILNKLVLLTQYLIYWYFFEQKKKNWISGIVRKSSWLFFFQLFNWKCPASSTSAICSPKNVNWILLTYIIIQK